MKDQGIITNRGAGGFLNPPTHPEHTHSVKGSISLTSAVDCEWLDEATRKAASLMLDYWVAPVITSLEIQNWIHQVLGYFKGCYCPSYAKSKDSDGWHDNLEMDDRNPMDFIGLHAGVHLIRKYYPDFVPTPEHFQNAYWGKKS